MFGKDKTNTPPPDRVVKINGVQEGKVDKVKNGISTTKYNLFTFLPKFLFEQFRKYWNLYFLMIGLMQQIPDVSPTGRYATIGPLMGTLALTAIKEMVEDISRRREDSRTNNRKVLRLMTDTKTWKPVPWSDLRVGDVVKINNKEAFPADLVLLTSNLDNGVCYVETSNLDGETNLKVKQSLVLTANKLGNTDSAETALSLVASIKCEGPNKKLYDFTGTITLEEDMAPLSGSQLLLRGSRLMNTHFALGVVVYSGNQSKLMMNSSQVPLKESTVQKVINVQIIYLGSMLMILALFSALFQELDYVANKGTLWYVGDIHQGFGWGLVTFIILYNNLIPISLQVTLEFVKFFLARFIDWDREMFHPDSKNPEGGTYAKARTSNLNEELGQIKYIFSDKTGTLTQNMMIFRVCGINGARFSETDKELLKTASKSEPLVEEFLTILSVCHTVIPEKTEEGDIEYNAASPDEKAFVDAARDYGFEFLERSPEYVRVRDWEGREVKYQVLAVIEFTSSRKRMSVLLRTEAGEVKLLTKGADNVMLARLGSGQEKQVRLAQDQMDEFARDGLRTMVFASRDIEQKEYEQWRSDWHRANIQLENRNEELDLVAVKIERDLKLVGVSAIEDKLQDEVPETIANLLAADIHVWVLTGDKQETAINIARSCRMITEDMGEPITINATDIETTKSLINKALEPFEVAGKVGQDNNQAVIVDGKTLELVFSQEEVRTRFVTLGTSCKSVICCRVSPSQKADVVKAVQKFTHGEITLAIGDGANDVSMIQAARVGVGISGNEGLQAANSADFSIAQFRFLQRLLFVHGAWSYSRVAKTLLYSFYKNIALYVCQMWFAVYNLWTGQSFCDPINITMFNVIFTALPPFALGILDRRVSDKDRMKKPSLYRYSQQGLGYNHEVFWRWILQSILHSVILFWVPKLAMSKGVTNMWGYSEGYLEMGTTIYTAVVVTACLKAGLEMETLSSLCLIMILGSILLWPLVLWLYSYTWYLGLGNEDMFNMAFILTGNFGFWFSTLVACSLCLGLDVIFQSLEHFTSKHRGAH